MTVSIEKMLRMAQGELVEGIYILKKSQLKLAANGTRFLTGVVSDAGGEIPIVFWDNEDELTSAIAEGSVVRIEGIVDRYNGKPQIKVSCIEWNIALEDIQTTDLVPAVWKDLSGPIAKAEGYIASIKGNALRTACTALWSSIKADFVRWPAGKSIHHDRLNGLLQHSLAITELAADFCEVYPQLDRDLMVAGALFHDIGKLKEFCLGDTGLVAEYSLDGELLGHLLIGVEMISEMMARLPDGGKSCAEGFLLLKHMIASHHGEPEYGACVRPRFVEAEILHHLDMIDSRVDIYAKAYAQMDAGTTEYIQPLSKRVYKPSRS